MGTAWRKLTPWYVEIFRTETTDWKSQGCLRRKLLYPCNACWSEVECLLRLKKPEDCCCSHTERDLMLAWCKREILMENGLFHLPRRTSELARQTDSIILLSCNYKSKERLEPCMTEHGLGERANSCIFVFWLLSHKISSWVLKEKYFWPLWLCVIFVNHAVSSALSWHHSSVLGVRKVQSPQQQSGDEHEDILPLVCPISIFSHSL